MRVFLIVLMLLELFLTFKVTEKQLQPYFLLWKKWGLLAHVLAQPTEFHRRNLTIPGKAGFSNFVYQPS